MANRTQPKQQKIVASLRRFFPAPRQSVIGSLLAPILGRQPAGKLIRNTARRYWQLISINLVCSLFEALTEGATLGVIFLAVQVLTSDKENNHLSKLPIIGTWPGLVGLFEAVPASGLFLALLTIALVLQALQSFMRYSILLSIGNFAARCRSTVTTRVHQQILNLTFPCASGYRVGDLVDYASYGPEAIRFQIEMSNRLLIDGLLVLTYLAVLIRISPWLLVVVAAIAGVVTAVQKKFLPRIRDGSRDVNQQQAVITSRITENFQGLRVLHSCGALARADQDVQHSMARLEKVLVAQNRRLAFIGPFSSFLPILAIVLIAALSVVMLQNRGANVLPSLVTFVLALQRMNQKIGAIAGNLNLLADNSGRIGRINEILSTEDKQFRRLDGQHFQQLQKEIRFENVGLRYNDSGAEALSDICFVLPRGKMLALVGTSGAGKSSIADLLVGLYTPTSGRIMIDQTPLDHLNLASWQQALGVVSQDTFLFNTSLANNIAFFSPTASREQIKAAAEAAQAAEFIERLPDGYDTLIGERGYRLSGGQRQRISLARAILRNPELLILDEATSALDTHSEQLVQEALERFERQHTVLVIAHRLSTIVRADEILVMDTGRIVQRGVHRSLIAVPGPYQQLWERQSRMTGVAADDAVSTV